MTAKNFQQIPSFGYIRASIIVQVKETWRTKASCIDLGLEDRLLFFGDSGYPVSAQTQYKKARLICYECPVQVECLMSAIDHKERTGVWGGLTESQRRRYAVPWFRREGKNDESAINLLESLTPGPTGSTRRNYRESHGSEPVPIPLPALSRSEDPIALAVG